MWAYNLKDFTDWRWKNRVTDNRIKVNFLTGLSANNCSPWNLKILKFICNVILFIIATLLKKMANKWILNQCGLQCGSAVKHYNLLGDSVDHRPLSPWISFCFSPPSSLSWRVSQRCSSSLTRAAASSALQTAPLPSQVLNDVDSIRKIPCFK